MSKMRIQLLLTLYGLVKKGRTKNYGRGSKIWQGNGIQRIVTLSPLTPMATHYHIRNGAKLLGHNPTTQNFEYKIQ